MSDNQNKKSSLHILFWIWVVLTVVGILVAIYGIPWLMPASASNTMHMSILTMVVFTVAAAPVAALVYSVVLFALAKSEMTVNVTGQQWVWSFQYPGTSVSSHDLYIPVNTDVKFDVTSKDVVHGFWIVQMGIKINANPDEITTTSVTATKTGTFDIRCTEICGLNHAFMVTHVHVLTKKNFEHWLATQPATI